MEIVLSQFVKSLAESGLMDESEIEAFINNLPLEKKPDDGAALARELVRQKKLTKYQAQAVYQGKVKALVLGDYVVLDRIGQGGMGQERRKRGQAQFLRSTLRALGGNWTCPLFRSTCCQRKRSGNMPAAVARPRRGTAGMTRRHWKHTLGTTRIHEARRIRWVG